MIKKMASGLAYFLHYLLIHDNKRVFFIFKEKKKRKQREKEEL
jgi:hypothetical protein